MYLEDTHTTHFYQRARCSPLVFSPFLYLSMLSFAHIVTLHSSVEHLPTTSTVCVGNRLLNTVVFFFFFF